MNFNKPGHPKGRVVFFLLGIFSILSISATYALAGGTVFLPLIIQPSPSPTATATLTPTPTLTPTATLEGTPGPTPLPAGTLQLVVNPANPDKAWALAFFAKSYNDAGRPVMQIYPSDTAPDSLRIKIPKGEIVLALEKPVTADGGAKYWQLVDYKGKDGEDLFLKATDVTKVTLNGPGN
jgi:hypothetical protein